MKRASINLLICAISVEMLKLNTKQEQTISERAMTANVTQAIFDERLRADLHGLYVSSYAVLGVGFISLVYVWRRLKGINREAYNQINSSESTSKTRRVVSKKNLELSMVNNK